MMAQYRDGNGLVNTCLIRDLISKFGPEPPKEVAVAAAISRYEADAHQKHGGPDFDGRRWVSGWDALRSALDDSADDDVVIALLRHAAREGQPLLVDILLNDVGVSIYESDTEVAAALLP